MQMDPAKLFSSRIRILFGSLEAKDACLQFCNSGKRTPSLLIKHYKRKKENNNITRWDIDFNFHLIKYIA